MDADSVVRTYIIVGVRADGGVPAMEVALCTGDGDAILKASRWLAEHRSCIGAQVWNDAELIGEVADPKHVATEGGKVTLRARHGGPREDRPIRLEAAE